MNNCILILIVSWFCFSTYVKSQCNAQFEDRALHLSEGNLVLNKKIGSFLDSYFDDKTLVDEKNYMLYIGQNRDIILLSIYNLRIAPNLSKLKPLGYINWKGKNIFLLSNISFLVTTDANDIVSLKYQEQIKQILNKKSSVNKMWLLKTFIYSDTTIVIKNRKSIVSELMPNIEKDK